jgi:hypothetical protein
MSSSTLVAAVDLNGSHVGDGGVAISRIWCGGIVRVARLPQQVEGRGFSPHTILIQANN